ncbi:ferritin-like domain-containing protein [Streptomyces sp. ST2-7A]|uniref:ferritin-like domain-containing protein n=1 Tax=Streptomyces sp. ST2-7A TaxID=2907214 RepID=UPI001F47A0CA|nr:ferritin-like domain-containing protein [Streptomyces sp. ST2-7A]MCE7080015.1 ferritin-like domain-containing protein [Streptomyces sp. ST2-7A]
MDPDTELGATRAALAAEHAAVYGYGVAGAAAGSDLDPDLRQAWSGHRSRRDALTRRIRDLGGEPPAAAAGYALPFEVTDGPSALALAAELETRLAAVYADLVRFSAGDARREAAIALREAAVLAARWHGRAVAFPGVSEYATPTDPSEQPDDDRGTGKMTGAHPPAGPGTVPGAGFGQD